MRQLLVAMIAMLLAVVSPVSADVVRLRNGETRSDVWITSLQSAGAGDLSLYAVQLEGARGGFPASYTLQELVSFELREPDDRSGSPRGRVGHVTSRDGRVIYNATVEGGFWSGQSFVLRMRRPGVPAGETSNELPLAQVALVRLGPMPIAGSDQLAAAPNLGGATGSYLADDAPGGSDSAAYLLPSQSGSNGPQSAEEMLEALARGSGTPGQPSSPFLLNPMPRENPFSLSAQGFYVILAGALALMVLTFLMGTFVLLFSARNEGIQDLTVGRAIAASALLAFIPPSLFVLCYLAIPVFIALKLFAGVSLFWISARMITMGFLEVMESKATDVLISFYAVMLLVVMVGWIYVTWGAG